ncbi:MAG: histone deacetylase [Candidatus Woesearchaeota archaeon]|jgi:acetoin utilization deacetylase AcuC-like enzyme
MKEIHGPYLIHHPLFDTYETKPTIEESPERFAMIGQSYLLQSPEIVMKGGGCGEPALYRLSPLEVVSPSPCTREDLQLFHSEAYLSELEQECLSLGEGEVHELDPDTLIIRESYNIAKLAVGSALKAADLANRTYRAFALVRPPGHHAHSNHASGFCLLNNIAIASEKLRLRGHRVLILDTDLHLGDGTLEYVEGRENVFYLSLNQEGIWPYQHPEDTHNSRNIFLPSETDDKDYINVLRKELPRVIRDVNPTIIAVSAGFDTLQGDLSSGLQRKHSEEVGLQLTANSYSYLWQMLNHSLIPYFAVLEGGYSPENVRAGVESFFSVAIHPTG